MQLTLEKATADEKMIKQREQELLQIVSESADKPNYQQYFISARKEIEVLYNRIVTQFNVLLMTLRRFHMQDFPTDQFFEEARQFIIETRPLYFKHFKLVTVDVTLSILGTEVYFKLDTYEQNTQYLMRQFNELPNLNFLAL